MAEQRRITRIGVLGAANIAAEAIVRPAARRDDVEITAIAARRPGAARDFAAEHRIGTAYEEYEQVIEDERVDVVYIALAARMVSAAGDGVRLVEGFHYRHHPLFLLLLRETVASGSLGALRSLTTELRDSRPFDAASVLHDPAVGGGTLWHAGCYPVHWMRTLTGGEPLVVSARAQLNPLGADETIDAELRFPGDITGRIHASMAPGGRQGNRLTLVGERGELEVENLIAPHAGHSVRLRIDGEAQRTFTVGGGTTFDYQLAAFLGEGAPPPPTSDIVANAVAIEAIYAAAGVDAYRGGSGSAAV